MSGAGGGRGGWGGGGGGGRGAGFPLGGMLYSDGVAAEDDDALALELRGPSITVAASGVERVAAEKQLAVLHAQQFSPYWLDIEPRKDQVQELPRYSDRYQPERGAPSNATSFLRAVPLQQGVFPPQLWESFTSSEVRRERRAARRGRVAIDWDQLGLEEKKTGEGDEDAPPESDEEDLGEYEDEEDDDYVQNYFDNGEDDDGGDEGGEEMAYD
ncbi:hypothetical protein MCUN1_000354 [Malassezia cuniculi]|uniref:DNA-directed RNA polymerase III subunit n=1 Tax=Malassezia cuniculi TaxID=948313 RepID=A0AAF0J9Q4_9BASI|nr:hypothetical protein MCUN1_000354 [Malassezia cuniculi]